MAPKDEWEPGDDGTKPGEADGSMSPDDLAKIEATGLSVDDLIDAARSNLQPGAAPAGSPAAAPASASPAQPAPKADGPMTREEAARVARVTAMTAVNQAGMESRVDGIVRGTAGFGEAGPEQVSVIHRAVAAKLEQNVRIASGRASDAEVNAALDAATKDVMADEVKRAKEIAVAADAPELASRLDAQNTAAVGAPGGASGKPSGPAGPADAGSGRPVDLDAQGFGPDTTWPTEGKIEDREAQDRAKFEASERTR